MPLLLSPTSFIRDASVHAHPTPTSWFRARDIREKIRVIREKMFLILRQAKLPTPEAKLPVCGRTVLRFEYFQNCSGEINNLTTKDRIENSGDAICICVRYSIIKITKKILSFLHTMIALIFQSSYESEVDFSSAKFDGDVLCNLLLTSKKFSSKRNRIVHY